MFSQIALSAVNFLKREDGPTAVEYAGPHHCGVHYRHHDAGQQRQRHLHLRGQRC